MNILKKDIKSLLPKGVFLIDLKEDPYVSSFFPDYLKNVVPDADYFYPVICLCIYILHYYRPYKIYSYYNYKNNL